MFGSCIQIIMQLSSLSKYFKIISIIKKFIKSLLILLNLMCSFSYLLNIYLNYDISLIVYFYIETNAFICNYFCIFILLDYINFNIIKLLNLSIENNKLFKDSNQNILNKFCIEVINSDKYNEFIQEV